MKSGASLIFAVLGFFIGGLVFTSVGWVTGAVLGFLLGAFIDMRRRIGELEKEVDFLNTLRPAPEEKHEAAAVPPIRELEAVVSQPPTFEEQPTPAPTVPKIEAPEPTPKAAPEPAPAVTPIAESPIVTAIKQYFAGGNLIVRVGVIVLFFGVAFLLKFAVDRGLIPIEVRLAGVALGALLMVVQGWRLRERRAPYALALEGGGIGILFMTVFAAFRIYTLLPAALAFALLVVLAVVSALLAVLQNSRALAILGIVGGFLAPVLASTGKGSHVVLFSYYAILNLGIFVVAWFKAWRLLNVLGFLFTFGIGAIWGYNYYQTEYFSTTEPFLILFFFMYVAISVLSAIRRPVELKGYVDGTLVFGTPIAAFALQASLVARFQYGLAWSALALGLFYLALTRVLFKKFRETLKLLAEAFLSTGTVFATLAIPFGLDARWTSALWALEGAAIVWIGIRQQRFLARMFGLVLQLAAGIAFLFSFRLSQLEVGTKPVPILNGDYLGTLIISLAGFLTAFIIFRNSERLKTNESQAQVIVFIWAALWWFGGGFYEIQTRLAADYHAGGVLLFITLSTFISQVIADRWQWPAPGVLARGLLPVMWVINAVMFTQQDHPLAFLGIIAWPLAFVAHYWILYRHDDALEPYQKFMHVGAYWLLTFLVTWELAWLVGRLVQGAGTWSQIIWGLLPALSLQLLMAIAPRLRWPVKKHQPLYLTVGANLVAVYLWFWILFVNVATAGDASPLPYVPILNPLDVALGFIFLILLGWQRTLRRSTPEFWERNSGFMYSVFAASLFLWLNAMLFRGVHHLGAVPFDWAALFDSVLVQALLSILWSLTGFGTMVAGTRKAWRSVWIVGAALLGVVVLKLFFIDLSNTGTVARIVSFIAVGIILLIVGYFSPVPPRAKSEVGKT